MATLTPSLPRYVRRNARRVALSTALWVFGVATTLLLIGLWGRAVTGDDDTLAESARVAVGTEVVAERVTEWISEGVTRAGDLAPASVDQVVDQVRGLPQVRVAAEDLVDQFVAAALAPPGSTPEIDVAGALKPAASSIAAKLQEAGSAVEVPAVEAALDTIGVITLETGDLPAIGGAARQARAALTVVVVVALAAMVVSGAAALLVADDRIQMARSLLVRVTVSALTFALILRIGAWATDPQRGRSPVAAGGSVVLRSNGWTLVVVAALTAAAAGGSLLIKKRRGSPSVG